MRIAVGIFERVVVALFLIDHVDIVPFKGKPFYDMQTIAVTVSARPASRLGS